MKENKNENNEEKIKFSERIAVSLKRQWLVSDLITILLVLVIIAAYFSINLWAIDADLPEIDITEGQIFTLSEQSKEAISKIDKDITIYVYGYEEDALFVKFVGQYTEANPKIEWKMLNSETNMTLLSEIGDSYNSTLVVVVCGDKRIFVTPDNDFTSSDFATGETIDVTEEKMTNTILSLAEENQPNVYFLTGHNEFIPESEGYVYYLGQLLKDEAYNVDTLNLLSSDIPSDCDIIAIVSPAQDISEDEANKLIAYINQGKNLLISKDTGEKVIQMPNLQKVLDLYGVTVDNSGFVLEAGEGKYVSTSNGPFPLVFYPDLNLNSDITSDLYNEQKRMPIIISYSGKLDYANDTEMTNLKVSKTALITTSETASFSKDLNNLAAALDASATGKYEVGALLEKEIKKKKDDGSEELVYSKLITFPSSIFFSDMASVINNNYPNILLGNNKDLILNSFSELAEKKYTVSIRKNTSTTSYAYVPTDEQSRVVHLIIFLYPLAIVVIGILIILYRRKRK